MLKDYDKYLSVSLKVYLFVLVIIFIMKVVGLDYFGLDKETIKIINNKIDVPILNNIIQFVFMFIQLYYLTYIAKKIKPKKINVFIATLINIITSYFIFYFKFDYLYSIISFEIIYFYLLCEKVKSKRIIKVLVINTILQIISNITRNSKILEYNFTNSMILSLDYMMMLLIYCEISKEEIKICQLHGLSLQKKINLKNLLKRLQENYHNFKKQPREEKLAFIIYLILSLIWNSFSLFIIILVAKLNNTLIECIFILSSFWLSKRAFGKAFHLSSMLHCFIVSNLSYYVLNRITAPLGISILIPVMLGVGLSYLTSKLVKKTYKPLYKGMPEDLFNETILKVTDKDSLKYKICYDFYIKKESDISLSYKYNYSEPGIRKIKSRINDKIKELK